jgi:AraC family transcriptional regulator, arabinose operon regulatory protein
MAIELPPLRMVYRTMGKGSSTQRIGAGSMDKSGVATDQRDVRPPTWSLVYVLRGRGTYYDHAGRAWQLRPGWCFQRDPQRRHSTILDPVSRWREVFIDLDPGLHRALAAMRILPPDPPAWYWGSEPVRVRRFADLIRDLPEASQTKLPALCVRALQIAVDAMADQRPSLEDDVDRACRALSEEAVTRRGLRAWCREQGLAYDAFRKAFQRRLGMPPGQYRIQRRVDHACALLQTTDLGVAEIAERLGYASPYEFSAQFRRRIGVPPTRYRSA